MNSNMEISLVALRIGGEPTFSIAADGAASTTARLTPPPSVTPGSTSTTPTWAATRRFARAAGGP